MCNSIGVGLIALLISFSDPPDPDRALVLSIQEHLDSEMKKVVEPSPKFRNQIGGKIIHSQITALSDQQLVRLTLYLARNQEVVPNFSYGLYGSHLLFELSKRGLADALADALTIHCPDQVGIRIDIEYLLELHTAKPGLGIRAMAKAAKVTNDIDNRNVIINALRRAFASLDEGEKDSVFVDKCIRWLDAHKVKLNLDYMPQGPRLDNHTHPPLFIEQK